jgi:hypothetical protein
VEVIARGRNVIGRNKNGFVISDDREFGLLGVWDGHLPAANQGRIVVDSTWHHWFNVNLRGLRTAGGNNYRDILAFFRNCAIWLAPKDQQAAMRRAGQRILLLTPTMVETLPTLTEFRPERFYPLGVAARDALGRIAPQCQSAAWFFDIVSPFMPAAALKLALNDRFEGVHNLFGGAGARLVVPHGSVVRVADHLGTQACLLALAATAYHSVALGGTREPATPPSLIIGHGIMGRLLARLTVAAGLPAPTVWETSAARRESGLGYPVVHPDDDDSRDHTAIYDVSGDASILDRVIPRLRPGGEVVRRRSWRAGCLRRRVRSGCAVGWPRCALGGSA